MTLHKILDAAYPPKTVPAGCAGVLGYIGGANAYHVWTKAEWAPFKNVRQFPCWVPDVKGKSTPAAAGHAATAEARALGWKASGGSRVLVCDLETTVDPGWYHAFATAVNDDGFYCVAYGSASTIAGNKATNVWAALYDGAAELKEGWHGKQYTANVAAAGAQVDWSVIDDWLFERGGVGPRR